MKILEGIQALPSQTFNTSLDGGDIITITLTFKPSIKMWFIDVEYNDFSVKGLRLCNVPNLLNQFDKIIPFGINVEIADGTEPFIINDLSTGRVILNILTAAEVEQINDSYKEAKI